MPQPVVAFAWFTAGLLAFAAASQSGFDSAFSLAFDAAATSSGLICWALAGATLGGAPLGRRLGWVPSGLSPAVVAGLVLGMLAISQIADWVISLGGYQEAGTLGQMHRALTAITHGELAVALVGIAVLPGIGEEVALRGFVQRGLEPRFGAVAAVGATSLLFGVLHGNPIHAAGALVLGLYLGAIVALCGSIRPAIACHVVNNAAATVGTALGIERGGEWLLLAGLVAGPWALWRTVLQARAAHPPLGGSPEPAPPPTALDPP